MRCGPALSECPYCGYTDRSAPLERRSPPGRFGDTPGGLEFRVEESIAEAEGRRVYEHSRFPAFELPRYNNAERTALGAAMVLLVFLHLPVARRRGPTIFDYASEESRVYILLFTIVLSLALAAAAFSGLSAPRHAAQWLALPAALCCLADVLGLLPFGASLPLGTFVSPVYAGIIIGLQGLCFVWYFFFLRRDTAEMLGH